MALGAIAAYLARPVDLIPDFMRFVGYLDDVILVALILDGLSAGPGKPSSIPTFPCHSRVDSHLSPMS